MATAPKNRIKAKAQTNVPQNLDAAAADIRAIGDKQRELLRATAEMQWRQRPPSVRITGAESVIETLERLGLSQFVRTKQEVNKDAILNEPDGVKGVAGITVVTGVEDFVITPFQQEVAA